jgi:hypothetical protein
LREEYDKDGEKRDDMDIKKKDDKNGGNRNEM